MFGSQCLPLSLWGLFLSLQRSCLDRSSSTLPTAPRTVAAPRALLCAAGTGGQSATTRGAWAWQWVSHCIRPLTVVRFVPRPVVPRSAAQRVIHEHRWWTLHAGILLPAILAGDLQKGAVPRRSMLCMLQVQWQVCPVCASLRSPCSGKEPYGLSLAHLLVPCCSAVRRPLRVLVAHGSLRGLGARG